MFRLDQFNEMNCSLKTKQNPDSLSLRIAYTHYCTMVSFSAAKAAQDQEEHIILCSLVFHLIFTRKYLHENSFKASTISIAKCVSAQHLKQHMPSLR